MLAFFFTKLWSLYSVPILRYRGSKIKLLCEKSIRSTFLKSCLQRTILWSCFSENVVSISVLAFEKFVSRVWKLGTCHEICEIKLDPKNKQQRKLNNATDCNLRVERGWSSDKTPWTKMLEIVCQSDRATIKSRRRWLSQIA